MDPLVKPPKSGPDYERLIGWCVAVGLAVIILAGLIRYAVWP